MVTTELCELAYKYGVDKCPRLKHSYTPYYYRLFKDKRCRVKKVLEIGVGSPETMQHVERVRGFYQIGASLYMWRDFFPNAVIYGADVNPGTMFEDERIRTYLCDERKEEDLVKLLEKTGSDIDLFIDDSSHRWRDQVFTCQNTLPLLQKRVIYVIEDVRSPDLVISKLSGFDCFVPNLSRRYHDDRLVLVSIKT